MKTARSVVARAVFLSCLLSGAVSHAAGEDTEFKVFRGKKPIPGIIFKEMAVRASISEPVDRKFRITLKLEGNLTLPDASLLISLGQIPTRPPSGEFELEVDARGPVTPVAVTVVSAEGEVEQEEIQLVANSWKGLNDRLVNGARPQKIFGASMSVVSTSYKQTDIPDFSQVSINGQVAYTHFLRPKTTFLQANMYGTLLPLTTSVEGTTLRQLGINARMGHYFWGSSNNVRLGVAFGAFYTSFTSSTDDFGFAGLVGYQFTPSLLYVIGPRDTVSSYLKVTPLFTPFSFADREVATGVSWTHTPLNGRPKTLGFDISMLHFSPVQGQLVDCTNLVFSFGMPWALK